MTKSETIQDLARELAQERFDWTEEAAIQAGCSSLFAKDCPNGVEDFMEDAMSFVLRCQAIPRSSCLCPAHSGEDCPFNATQCNDRRNRVPGLPWSVERAV